MVLKKMTRLLIVLILLGMSGCYITPVRHLAADAAMVQVGVTTRDDVVVFLGQPDQRQELAGGVEALLYKEVHRSFFEKLPYLGKYIGSPEYRKVVIIVRKGVVVKCSYSSSDEDEESWSKDFSWQEKE